MQQTNGFVHKVYDAAEDRVAFGDTWEFVVCLCVTDSFSSLSGKMLND